MKVAVGLRRVAAGKRTSGRRAAQIAHIIRPHKPSYLYANQIIYNASYYITPVIKNFLFKCS